MSKPFLITYSIMYRIVLDITYIYGISPLYSYSGLTLEIVPIKLLCSYILQVIVVLLMSKYKKPSNILYYFFILFVTIPTLSFYGLNNQNTTYMLWFIVSCLLTGFIIRLGIKPAKLLNINYHAIIKLLFYLYVFVSIYLFLKRGGIDLRSLNFDTVYGLRAESNINGIDGYFLNWCAKAGTPFFFSYYNYYNSFIKKYTSLLVQLLLYLSFGNKAFLFSILALIGVSFVMKYKHSERKFTVSMISVLTVSFLIDKILHIDFLRRGIPYRMLYIPSQIQFQYYDFFKERPKLHFAESIIGKVFDIETGFNTDVPIIISRYYSGNANNMSFSNTGIFSDAFANLGIIGMILFAVIFSLSLLCIDAVSKNIPNYITISAFSYIIFVINDTSFLTTFVTGGFGLMLVLLYLMNGEIAQERLVK